MKRSAPMKRSPWPRRGQPEPGTAPASVKTVAKPLERPVRYAQPANEPLFAAPKPVAHRNRRLLDLARGMPCLLRIERVCNGRTDTTVACHSNLSIHGKAGARKADDFWSCWGCSACHWWLDRGPADALVKEAAFLTAHLLQVVEWRRVSADTRRTLQDRRAVEWALSAVSGFQAAWVKR
ncbi:nuclease domain-containing protein [Variovorax sp.]|uniref:nuclease domain-containing protein n=1 Tax=Variovorax sp. TaxID=1871043 RepID=UPI003BACF766